MKTLGLQVFRKTRAGQLVYDLAFVTRSDKWLARKHHLPIGEIRAIRQHKAVKKLTAQVAKERR